MRTPDNRPADWTGPQMAAILEARGFTADRAIAIIGIARMFGMNAEALPEGSGGGVVTVRYNGVDYTITDRMELL